MRRPFSDSRAHSHLGGYRIELILGNTHAIPEGGCIAASGIPFYPAKVKTRLERWLLSASLLHPALWCLSGLSLRQRLSCPGGGRPIEQGIRQVEGLFCDQAQLQRLAQDQLTLKTCALDRPIEGNEEIALTFRCTQIGARKQWRCC